MTTSPAGWYPDPAGSGGTRWWDGTTWGEHVQPAAQPVAAGRPWQPAGQPWAPGVPQQGTAAEPDAPQAFLQRNKTSLIALALVAVCVLIAATTNYILFAFVPAIVAAQAVPKKEPLAWPAVGIGIALIVWRFTA
jgi:hypothetical protein